MISLAVAILFGQEASRENLTMPLSAAVRGGFLGLGRAFIASALLVGCGQQAKDGAPPASRPLTGANTEEFGAQGDEGESRCLKTAASWLRVDGLMERECRTCHSALLAGPDRFGAPEGVDFDTEQQVRRHSARIRARAVELANMPPSGPLPECSRVVLREYLDHVADDECQPDCVARYCGDDNCGGSCGECEDGLVCSPAGVCGECVPACDGRQCGEDGCRGSCGECDAGTACNGAGTCECVPQCDGRACGDDGCGGSCGSCEGNGVCSQSGACICEPSCSDKECGDDGCGGVCGQCLSHYACSDVQTCECTPDCDGKACGSNGCGGSCGSCGDGLVCNTTQGECVSSCTGDCSGRSCGDDGCGVSCGECEDGLSCDVAGACVCVPDCTGKQCGEDGCGGSCGECGAGLDCSAEGHCECTPQCDGRECGTDGCGGSCGTCEEGESCDAGLCVCTPVCMEGSCGGADGCGGTCGCDSGKSCDSGSCVWPDVSFANDVFPLFGTCAGNCHAGMMPKASLDLVDVPTAYAELVGAGSVQCSATPKTLVVPGDIEASYLINKLTGIGMCDPSTQRQMPRGTGAVPLTESQIDVIRAWIANGAEND